MQQSLAAQQEVMYTLMGEGAREGELKLLAPKTRMLVNKSIGHRYKYNAESKFHFLCVSLLVLHFHCLFVGVFLMGEGVQSQKHFIWQYECSFSASKKKIGCFH